MERIVDYLAEELAREEEQSRLVELTQHSREWLLNVKPRPASLDFLGI